ncbi:Arabinose 5-phosphate isomerase KdsD [Pelotomaculum sp. FP]|uniref:KpsF/GutQ family sugar-phosphate isomerase n=1 Tax=Pelotomaculum sp. FP TaxID=261474 RepID=UPI00106475A4|nr:KpsF/GutQ family sugar-phosphate isomerase [Pelotomaculum sp. FP]TEB16179.1 Arabinose 5-phosphate isomerase KdsD [Pelotomaculum sp. FP]
MTIKQKIETNEDYREQIGRHIRLAGEYLLKCSDNVPQQVNEAVKMILACRGHVALTGIGKSGLIARKLAATLASTGTPSFYLHPAEAGHGDLGMVTGRDILLVLSESGESDEIITIIPAVRDLEVPVLLITFSADSRLAGLADTVILMPPVGSGTNNVGPAPTVSSVAMMALGDAIALACAVTRHFGFREFARFHPCGALGRRLLFKVRDLMKTGEAVPLVSISEKVSNALFIMSEKGQGAVFVLSGGVPQGKLVGILTDGDVRRLAVRYRDIWDLTVEDVMTRNPLSIIDTSLAINALQQMEQRKVTILPVLNEVGELTGSIHMHQLLEAGIKS